MVLTTMLPIGSLIISVVSHYIGVQKTVLAEGIVAVIIAALYSRYLKKEKLKKEQQSYLERQREEVLIQA